MNYTLIGSILGLGLLTGFGVSFGYFQQKYQYCYKYYKNTNAINLEKLHDVKNIVPVAILGSGPAGLAASIYAGRQNMYNVVFQGNKPGGQLTETSYVENWPGISKSLGVDIMNKTQKQAERFGSIMANESIESIDVSSWPFKLYTEDKKEINALSIILATGATPLKLDIPGEDKFWGMGVTTCAICDAPYYKGKKVIVVGGGDSAVEEATLLASFASQVQVFVRKDVMRAAPVMKSRLSQHSNISVVYNTEVKEILGDDTGVTQVLAYNNKDNTTKKIAVDGVFLAIGHKPNTAFLNNKLLQDKNGYLVISPRGQETSQSGIFAAGDVSDPDYKQAAIAAGDGVRAALQSIKFLEDNNFDESFSHEIENNFYDPDSDLDKEAITIHQIKNEAEFDEYVKSSKNPVLIDFYAPSCIACSNMLPHISSVAAKFTDKMGFVKIDRDESPELAKKLNVSSVPQILIFDKGKEVARHKTAMTKRQLYNLVSEYVHQ